MYELRQTYKLNYATIHKIISIKQASILPSYSAKLNTIELKKLKISQKTIRTDLA
ncbi:unnamed protein product [Paramecium sonneborni]|uniref:Uncharacterized protein n=1 Tax=Paramecium sonneborni TaxID=65129 RepID=A0A8S1KSR5_9CILI|nr:unnamed protein product [Paramecium sonneborni]